jgi:hypothetical protein
VGGIVPLLDHAKSTAAGSVWEPSPLVLLSIPN